MGKVIVRGSPWSKREIFYRCLSDAHHTYASGQTIAPPILL